MSKVSINFISKSVQDYLKLNTLLLFTQLSFTQIVINEIMPLNISTIADEDGDFSDWIELYNSGSSSINLDGMQLSDDVNDLGKWVFPNKTLSAGEYILIFSISGAELNNGVYYCVMECPEGIVTKKLIHF